MPCDVLTCRKTNQKQARRNVLEHTVIITVISFTERKSYKQNSFVQIILTEPYV